MRTVTGGTTHKWTVVVYSHMGDKKFTLIELHLDGETQFGPRMLSDALPIGGDGATADEDEMDSAFEEATDEDEGGVGAIGVVVGLVLLVGVALAVKKLRGGDDESELETAEEPEIIVD